MRVHQLNAKKSYQHHIDENVNQNDRDMLISQLSAKNNKRRKETCALINTKRDKIGHPEV